MDTNLVVVESAYRLFGPVPSKKNRVRFSKSGGVYHDKIFSDWHKAAEIQILNQQNMAGFAKKSVFGTGNVIFVKLDFTYGSLRKKDLTNSAESVMDLLVDCGVLPDDNFKVVSNLMLTGKYKKGKDEALISIWRSAGAKK